MAKKEEQVFYNPINEYEYYDFDEFIEELDLDDFENQWCFQNNEFDGYELKEEKITESSTDYKRGYTTTRYVVEHKATGLCFGWEYTEGITEWVQDEVLWKGRVKKKKIVSYEYEIE